MLSMEERAAAAGGGAAEAKVGEESKGEEDAKQQQASQEEQEEGTEAAVQVQEEEQMFTFEGLFNTKPDRLETVEADLLPDAYRKNSRKEELCLEFVENYVRQFEALFPKRKRLFVTPRNECGIPKFVCTTVRPTQLPFKHLYNVTNAAEFFSHFMQYEPLENPTRPPTCLPSPSFTLEHQVGDCFDLATLLCSYLVGSGYDAYVVMGYAPRDVTLLNRTQEECPLKSKTLKEIIAARGEDNEEVVLEDLRGEREEKLEEEIVDDLGDATSDTGEHGEGTSEGKEPEEDAEGKDAVGDDALGESKGEGNLAGDEQAVGQTKGSSDGAADAQGDESKAGDSAEAGEGSGEADGDASHTKPGDEAGIQDLGATDPGEDVDEDPYAVNSLGVKPSEYLRRMSELKLNKDESKEESESEGDPDEPQDDPLEGRRVHAWVLVRAGKRMMDKTFFVEPSTGRLYNVNGSPYQGVEAVWNNKNYWVNMQGDVVTHPMDLSYNLEMEENWEYIFVDSLSLDSTQAVAADSGDGLDAETGGAGVGLDEEDQEDDAQAESKRDKEMVLDLPPTWVTKLCLSRDAFRRKYNTTGQRTQLFHKSKLESYAEHLHVHGLVQRMVLFRDRARTLPVEVREYFANRRDKLQLRIRFPLQGRVQEFFAEGRASGLRLTDEVVGKARDLHFYDGARLDGLNRREEVMGEHITEHFSGRDDHLETRTVNLRSVQKEADATRARARGEAKAEGLAPSIPKNTMTLPRAQHGGDLTILRMEQVFQPNAEVDADSDIAERVFDLQAGTISVIFHYAKGRITRSSRRFHKDPSVAPEINLAQTFAPELLPSQVENEFQTHCQAEKDCYQNIRDTEREMQDILALRKREESAIVLEKSVFDTARDKAKQDNTKQNENQVEEAKDPRHVDYLTPFLHHIPDLSKIRRDEAESARDACLKSLKERLLERANIIQCRLDEENAQLAKKQAAFQRSRDHVDGADQEFERFCSEAMFRIQILEQRLARHEESALSVYANLDQKLRMDPRIAILFTQS